MPWVGRAGTHHRYYVRTIYRKGRPYQRYFGRGQAAHYAAAFDAARRQRRQAQREKRQQARQQLQQAYAPLDRLATCCRTFRTHYLTMAGFHQHHRTWRRKRGHTVDTHAIESLIQQAEQDNTVDTHAIKSLIQQAERGNRAAFAHLQAAPYQDAATLVQLKQHAGDLASRAIDLQCQLAFPDNLIAQQAIREAAEEMAQGLLSEHPTQLERVLIEQLVCCWVGVSIGGMMATATAQNGPDKPLAREWEKRYDRALVRFRRTAQTLAQTRKLINQLDS